mgnify:CR=1 FL=1
MSAHHVTIIKMYYLCLLKKNTSFATGYRRKGCLNSFQQYSEGQYSKIVSSSAGIDLVPRLRLRTVIKHVL